MKILFYSPVKLNTGGGCERWHCDITNSLRQQFGDDIKIITANLGDDKWTDSYLSDQLDGISYQKINFPIFLNVLIPTPSIIFKLYKEIKKADAVHFIYGFIGQDFLMAFLRLLTGTKIVIGHHAPTFHISVVHNFYMKYISRWLMSAFDAHQTLNSKDKTFLEKSWHIKNVHFIPSGIRVTKFLKVKKTPHKTLNFLCIGRYEMQKGYDLLLESIHQFNLKYRNNQARFYFVGGGLLKDLIQNSAKKNKNVIDLGYIPYEKLPKIYANTDALLLPSREEPFGLVLIESWASGIPVIATKTEGPLDMLTPNIGMFIEQISSSSILSSIEKFYIYWQNQTIWDHFSKKTCIDTALSFSIDTTAKRMRGELFV